MTSKPPGPLTVEKNTQRSQVVGAILSYHRVGDAGYDPWGMRVTPELFAEQMSVLAEIGKPTPLAAFARLGQREFPSRLSIAVTFDDGYVDNAEFGLPILQRYDIPATVFVSTGYTGKPYFWWEALEQIFLRPRTLPPRLAFEHGGKDYSWLLGEAAEYTWEQYAADSRACKWRGLPGTRVRLYFEVYDALWDIAHQSRLRVVGDIISWAGLGDGAFSDARPMTADELIRLGSDERITIGGHSVDHLPLDQASSAVQKMEICGGQSFLETLLGRRVDSFAYPHGKYTPETIRLLRDRGFVVACSTLQTAVKGDADPMLMPRLVIKNWDRDEFKLRLSKWIAA